MFLLFPVMCQVRLPSHNIVSRLTSCLLAILLSPFPVSHSLFTFTEVHHIPSKANSTQDLMKKLPQQKQQQWKKWRFHGGLEICSGKRLNSYRSSRETRHEILYSSAREGRENSHSSTKPSRADDQSTLESLLDESQLSYPKIS